MKAGSDFNSHKFLKCVEQARSRIIGEGHSALASRSLLAELIYDNEGIDKINLSNLTWQNILDDYSDWKSHFEVTEYSFVNFKEILHNKISI